MSGARHWPVDNATYHKDTTAISFTGLKEMLRDPAEYYGRRLDPNRKPNGRVEDPEWAEIGNRLHDAMFRPGDFGADFVIIPDSALTKNKQRRGRAWESFKADNPGKVLLKDGEIVHSMLEVLRRHEDARKLLGLEGHHEYTVVWHDDEFDVDRRCRFDKVAPGNKIIVDYKSTREDASPAECVRIACQKKFRYYAQQEFYRDGAQEFFGERFDFYFIFQSKAWPYRVEVIRMTQDERFVRSGQAAVRRGLRTYSQCLKSGVWLPETHGRVVDVPAPAYLEHSDLEFADE